MFGLQIYLCYCVYMLSYLLGMGECEPSEDVGACTNTEPDERLDAEVSQHVVQLIGKLIHRRVYVAVTQIITN